MHFLMHDTFDTHEDQMYVLMLLQVVHMQCNVEPVEEGTKFHVSILCKIYFVPAVIFRITAVLSVLHMF